MAVGRAKFITHLNTSRHWVTERTCYIGPIEMHLLCELEWVSLANSFNKNRNVKTVKDSQEMSMRG